MFINTYLGFCLCIFTYLVILVQIRVSLVLWA